MATLKDIEMATKNEMIWAAERFDINNYIANFDFFLKRTSLKCHTHVYMTVSIYFI